MYQSSQKKQKCVPVVNFHFRVFHKRTNIDNFVFPYVCMFFFILTYDVSKCEIRYQLI